MLWSLTPIEFDALKKQFLNAQRLMDLRWAEIQATLYNAHFRGPQDVEWTAADILGEGNRKDRQLAANKQRAKDLRDMLAVNMKLSKMKRNEEPADLPEWAKR